MTKRQGLHPRSQSLYKLEIELKGDPLKTVTSISQFDKIFREIDRNQS